MALAVAIQAALPATAAAYSEQYWNGSYATEYPENIACVAASALTHVGQVYGYTDASHYLHSTVQAWYTTGRTHNRYTYAAAGLDPRSWAWLLWKNTPAGYSYHDYWWPSQGTANMYIESGLTTTHQPVGALTDHGHHAVNVVGFNATADPRTDASSLLGFWIVDPYYHGSGTVRKSFYGGYVGDPPNTYIALATWNSAYLTYYYDTINTIWTNSYVAVLRTANNSPEPTKSYDTQPPMYGYTATASLPATSGGTSDKAYPKGALDQAVTDGIASNTLLNDPSLGVSLVGAVAGKSLHVDSLSPELGSYELVEVLVAGKVKAIAMIEDRKDGLHFAALQPVAEGSHMPSALDAQTGLRAKGVDARSLKAVWGWSQESSSPFSPFWQATDSNGRQTFLTSSDQVQPAIHLTTAGR